MEVMREVHIKPVLNGFVITVGCQTLVFNRIIDVAKHLVRYQRDPENVEKEFLLMATNKTAYLGATIRAQDQVTLSTSLY